MLLIGNARYELVLYVHFSLHLHVFKKSLVHRWNMFCAFKRRLQFIFHQVQESVFKKIQRNVFTALSAFLFAKRKLSVLNGLSIFLTRHKASCVLQGAFTSWRTYMKFSRFTIKSVDRVFQKIRDHHCSSGDQRRQLLAFWKLAASRSSKGSLVTVLIQNFFQRSLGRRILRGWQAETLSFLERQRAIFKNRGCFFVAQRMFRFWAIHVQSRIMKSSEIAKRNAQFVTQKALMSWSFAASLKHKMKTFEFRRLLSRFKKWRWLVSARRRFNAKDAFIIIILAKGCALNLCRFVFRRWIEHTAISVARTKRKSAAIQLSIKRNQMWLHGAFGTWIQVKTTSFSLRRIISERLRKLFFRWHTFVEYRRSKSLLKSKLQQQSSPPSNAR